jgi:hypothetical protein
MQSMPLSEIKKIKVKDKTAIPTGTYNMIVNVSPFPKIGKTFFEILDLPFFS